ncbi:GDCCVxC domain-containing (seleno)protein [Colwellia chukchiensis]|uniref:GDCCVxC domain-containing (seleno)protein n=1 Tax=Colwellia chukchiensis TaxID=641665 RepID=UPI000A17777E|nr:GDCCVxC domain-containing (seleno)protein [Colwellia chukchiensis]
MAEIITKSQLKCPECGHTELIEMPTNSCQWFSECTFCKALLKPIKGDCCVFCSYGSVPCPPVQEDGSCSSCGD